MCISRYTGSFATCEHLCWLYISWLEVLPLLVRENTGNPNVAQQANCFGSTIPHYRQMGGINHQTMGGL